MWYQALGENSPDAVHAMFATLVPGFPSPFPNHSGLAGLSNSSSAVFHDINHGKSLIPIRFKVFSLDQTRSPKVNIKLTLDQVLFLSRPNLSEGFYVLTMVCHAQDKEIIDNLKQYIVNSQSSALRLIRHRQICSKY